MFQKKFLSPNQIFTEQQLLTWGGSTRSNGSVEPLSHSLEKGGKIMQKLKFF